MTQPASPLKAFLLDLLRLLWWSFLYPTKLVDYMHSLHPDLTIRTGFSQQIWLACHSPAVRRFLALQITLWGLAGMLFLSIVIVLDSSNLPISRDAVIVMAVVVAISFTVVVAGVVVGGMLVVLAVITAGVLASHMTGILAFVVAFVIAVSLVAPAFDGLRQRTVELLRPSYWGRSLIGTIGLFFGGGFVLAGPLAFSLVRNVVGVIAGVVVGIVVSVLTFAGMVNWADSIDTFEKRVIDRNQVKWLIIDGLLLNGVIGVTMWWASGVADGVLFSIFFGVGVGISMRAGNGLSAILIVTGVVGFFTAFSHLSGLTITLFLGGPLLVGLCGYVRLPFYFLEAPWNWWLYLQARRNPTLAPVWLRRSPVYWDELIFYPLPMLDRLLLLALRQERQARLKTTAAVAANLQLSGPVLVAAPEAPTALPEVEFIARSFRQRWATNRARLAFAAEILAECAAPSALASAPAELEWLADEVMVELKQGTSEVIPRLLAIAQGVKTTLEADNPYSQRLGYREALDGLDTLQRRLPSLGQQAAGRWQPVLDQWQKVLLDALEAISTNAATVTTTENPYQPGNPLQLTRKELFKDRRELREAVVNALLERNRPTLVLQGPRRMGKTSFLLQLPALLPGNTLPIFLDLQRPAVTQNTAAFLYHLARAISRDARPYRLMVEPPQQTAFNAAPFAAFAAWLEDIALPALQEFNLLLTFDEFENLGKAVEAGRLDSQIFDELRYLIQHQTRLALLFAGVQTLDELGPAWSSYFINVKPLTIGYLNPAEAEELIRTPDPGADFRLTYADAVVAEIMAQTRCQPYLLQLLCSAIVEESNARATLHADTVILEAALVRALDQGELYFRNVWDEMAGPEGQPLLRQIAQASTSLSLPDSPALARLVRRRVLTRTEAGYTVEIPLVRRWIAERAP